MSIESVRAFLERMKTDKAFFDKVSACKDAASRMEVVRAEGFDFTADELEKVKAELSTEDLEGISGGICVLKCDLACDRFEDRCIDCPSDWA